jgi:rubrerythrin
MQLVDRRIKMKKQGKTRRHGAAAAVVASAPSAESTVSTAAGVLEPTTLENLQKAYNGEINAHARYRMFADEAGDEGYTPVASLFRAVARAEDIHAGNHADVIRSLGAEPKAGVEGFPVKLTRENLDVAIKGEVHERDEMYPHFWHQAHAEGNELAVRTFHFALKSEIEHVALFTEAQRNLESLRGEGVVYCVCPVCGFTSAKGDSRCPVCSTAPERFENIS